MVLSPELFVIIFTALSSLLMGTIVLLKDTSSSTGRAFSGLTTVISLWSITNYLSLHGDSPESTLFWIRIVMVITSFLGPILFVFLTSFPKRHATLPIRWNILVFCLATLLAIASMTPLLFSGITIVGDNISPTPGPLLPVFMGTFFLTTIAGMISIIRKFRKSRGAERLQIRYLLIGTVVTFTALTATNLLAVVFLRTSKLVFLGPAFPLIMLGFIAYAILKHRLLNISGLIARTVSYVFLVGVISAFYSLAFFATVYVLFPSAFASREITVLFSSILALVVGFTIPSLQRFFEHWTDRLLYKTKTNERKIFTDIANLITSTFDLDTLSNQVTALLYEQLRTTYVKIILFGEQETFFFQSAGTHEKKIDRENITPLRENRAEIVVFEEIDQPALKDWMQSYEISVIVNLQVKGNTVGAILLGGKASGEIFYDDDLSFLPTLGDQLSVAFENALAVRQISQFNKTLQEEIAKATSDLEKANEELQALDKLKDEFLSMASHELKSPMNAVKNYLWMSLNKGLENPGKLKEYLTVAYDQIQRLTALVNDLLDVSRIESGRIKLDIKDIDLSKAISETVEIYGGQAKDKGLTLISTVAPAQHVLADDLKLREILANLISNAVKYTLTGAVTISVEQSSRSVRISVTDTGSGITPEDQQKLFQKFSRVNESYKGLATVEGTGLGLYISKKFVEMMDGQIGLDSEIGKGSTFWVELPLATQPKADSSQLTA